MRCGNEPAIFLQALTANSEIVEKEQAVKNYSISTFTMSITDV